MRKSSTMCFLAIAAISVFFLGCATSLPMTSSLNDFVIMGTNANTDLDVSFAYESDIVDGLVKPYERDKAKLVSGHAGFNHTQSSTLGRMINEYMQNKYSRIDPTSSTTVVARLSDFWIEQYSTDSGGKQMLAALAGGEINMMCVAKVKVRLTVEKEGEVFTKVIAATAEDVYVSGIGTGTETSNIYRGKNSIEHTHARNINSANNKVLMMINSYLEELGM
jgi:hypothetical protein